MKIQIEKNDTGLTLHIDSLIETMNISTDHLANIDTEQVKRDVAAAIRKALNNE